MAGNQNFSFQIHISGHFQLRLLLVVSIIEDRITECGSFKEPERLGNATPTAQMKYPKEVRELPHGLPEFSEL